MRNYIEKQIDRYTMIASLGMGGMAVVYKAYDTRLEREVALKLIRAEAIPAEQHERLMKRFEREAKSQARFNHRHIVPVYDYGKVDSAPYLVMAYIPGGTLKLRTGQPIPYQQALRWLIPIADALSYAHKRGVIHRDIKPSNILFDDEDQPILTDFGIAKILETDDATLTGTGLGVGTPEYMSPEQWQGQATAASDQYALAVVLYELITGQKPYTADTPVAVALLVMTETLRSPQALAPSIPEGVEKLLYKALAKDPEDRYEDMAALRKALETQLITKPVQAGKSDETILPEAIFIAAGPVPGPAPQPMSEAETVDELTPASVVSQPVKKAVSPQSIGHTERGKAKLPGWLLWAGGVALTVILLGGGMTLLTRGSSRVPAVAAEPTEGAFALLETSLTTATDAPELTWTETHIPSPSATETQVPTFTPTLEPTLGIGSMMVNPVDGALMVYVPEGEFLMGSTSWGAWEDEKPERLAYLNAFWLYQHEVTNEKYRQCIEAGDCNQPGKTAYYKDSDYDDHPVMYVNWNDAATYCQWAGGRLPTEAEWEKAARGTDGRKYPWGDKDPNCSLANFTGCVGGTAAVGSYPDGASPYGAMDMAGNVWEWVSDWYEKDYYNLSPYDNPIGPDEGTARVLRGGSWYNISRSLRVSYRYRSDPDSSGISYGFRCLHLP